MELAVKAPLKQFENWNIEGDIQRFEAENAEKGQIVFYGPSNFTRWSREWGNIPLREALLGKSGKPCCVNRGFGTSAPEHHLCFYSRVIRPLEPKALVYSPGLGNSFLFGYTAEETFRLAQRVVQYARNDFPDMPIYIVDMSLFKQKGKEKYPLYKAYSEWLRELCDAVPGCTFLDVNAYEPLNSWDLLAEDKIHFNAEGYRRYAEFFKEALKHELDQFKQCSGFAPAKPEHCFFFGNMVFLK